MATRKQSSRRYLIPDGHPRSDEVEHKINEAMMLCFRDKCGEDTLDYLRSITVNQVVGPQGDLSHQGLAFREGMKFLVHIITKRIEHGRNKLPKVEDKQNVEA